jgi:hypothetical protein
MRMIVKSACTLLLKSLLIEAFIVPVSHCLPGGRAA